MNTVTKVLIEARELISDPERWSQRGYACDARGQTTMWDSPKAVSWCAFAAIRKAAGAVPENRREHNALVERAQDKLARVIGGRGVFWFNTSHTHAEVLAAFDRTIAEGEA